VLLRGSGRVTAVERSRVLLEVEGTLVALVTGPVFGNAVRDGSGLVEVNDVPGLAEFNEVSAVINRLVEERVQPGIRAGARPGVVLRFAGCAEVPETLAGRAGAAAFPGARLGGGDAVSPSAPGGGGGHCRRGDWQVLSRHAGAGRRERCVRAGRLVWRCSAKTARASRRS
jgi:hypothetical protein